MSKVAAAVGVGVCAAGVSVADPVDVSFTSGGLGVATGATSIEGVTDTNQSSSGVDDVFIEAEGSSSSGLVSSFGSFSASISEVEGRNNPGFTRLTLSGSIGLFQDELGGSGFAQLTTGSPSEPAPLIITLETAAVFDISTEQFGQFDAFEFLFLPVPDTGAGMSRDMLLPGSYEISISALLTLEENEFGDDAGFQIDINLSSAPEFIPLPGAAGLCGVGVGLIACRRRRG